MVEKLSSVKKADKNSTELWSAEFAHYKLKDNLFIMLNQDRYASANNEYVHTNQTDCHVFYHGYSSLPIH